jgi:hypothetical protein
LWSLAGEVILDDQTSIMEGFVGVVFASFVNAVAFGAIHGSSLRVVVPL